MSQPHPLVIGFVADPGLQARLTQELGKLSLATRWLASAADLAPVSEAQSGRQREPGENIFGRSGALLDQLVRTQPALLIFATGNQAIPWRRWLPMLKRSPATRRIPVLLLAENWSEEESRAAHSLGATVTLNLAQIEEWLRPVVTQHARIPDYDAIASACHEPIDPRAITGIDAYNAGNYYDAHEFLEHAWQDDKGAGRDLYRAILQIAVALYQVRRENYNGAVKMLLRVQQWLQPLPDTCRGVDVAALRADALTYYESVLSLGPDHLTEFAWDEVRPVARTASA